MDYQTILVALFVGAALVYAGKKAWNLVKPGTKAGGCGCSSSDAQSGCGGCPLVKP